MVMPEAERLKVWHSHASALTRPEDLQLSGIASGSFSLLVSHSHPVVLGFHRKAYQAPIVSILFLSDTSREIEIFSHFRKIPHEFFTGV
jgi:hypothetical protein